MATSLAAQLAKIAAKSTNSLNLKAQKAAHGQSLIFEPGVAATQDFDSLYTLCAEGFEEICLLDRRFAIFRGSIFSQQSKTEDRTQMTEKENEQLNIVLEDFMGLVGARLLLKPAIMAVEWLVRRFRYGADHLYLFSIMTDSFAFQGYTSIIRGTRWSPSCHIIRLRSSSLSCQSYPTPFPTPSTFYAPTYAPSPIPSAMPSSTVPYALQA